MTEEAKAMKRHGNLYAKVCSIENLQLADILARKGKLKTRGVRQHDKNREANIMALHEMLVSKTYRTGDYRKFIVKEPKVREISSLDYYPHRIVHHAIMNVIEPLLTAVFTADSYGNIRGKGIDGAHVALKAALKDEAGTRYCLKFDVQKFYPSIDHDILKALVRRKIKDADLLWLLDEIIDSAQGVPIGNYLSQYFANLYLNGLDHHIKERLGVKHYFRYVDDMVLLAATKPQLHAWLYETRQYLETKLNLIIKKNYQVFEVDERGIDFLGGVFRHEHVRMRKTIKQNFAREANGRNRPQVIAGFLGWAYRCNARHLLKKLNHERF